MNQQWLIDHVLREGPSLPESPENLREYLSRDEATGIVDATLDYLGAHGDETEYNYMRGHRTRLIHALSMIPKAENAQSGLLDIGCYGYMAFWAAKHLGYQRVVGIEWHPELSDLIIHRTLQVGDDQLNFDSYNFDITMPNWPIEGQFDTVLFFEVLEHINEDPMGVMERINALLTMGGTLVMSVPNAISYKTLREYLVGMPPWTYWFYQPDLSHEPRHCFEYTPIVFQSVLVASGMRTNAFRTIYAYSTMEKEQRVLDLAEGLGFDRQTLGETMIAHATKQREGVPLRHPDVLYSPEGYYKNIYPRLQPLLEKRLSLLDTGAGDVELPSADSLLEVKPSEKLGASDHTELIAQLEAQAFELASERDEHRELAISLQEQKQQLQTQVTQLLFQSDCNLQREQGLNATATEARQAAEQAAQAERETREWADRLSQENADLRAQVNELLFACDCYLQQINDPARCVQVIRQRRFRWALDRSKSIARKTPIARTVLRPVYRSAKKAIKRRM